jgi:type 1 glutamine amidotransferase
MRKALVVQGGWQGHEPGPVSEILTEALHKNGVDVTVSDTLDSFKDEALMQSLSLVVPIWTMGDISGDQLKPLLEAVKNGCGIAGVHGGMGDAFRQQTEFQFMVGGQWVAHPGGAGMTYKVHMLDPWHPLTQGIDDFEITSEQYYMHVDPANCVHAITMFGYTAMPVIWTKSYGKGRVYYCSLGHVAENVRMPQVLELVTRGMMWAAAGK